MLPDPGTMHYEKAEPMLSCSPNARSTVTDEGLVLLDVSTGSIFQSNPVGSRIWQKLQAGVSLPQVVEEISLEFNAAPSQVEPDVREFVAQLRERNLIAT